MAAAATTCSFASLVSAHTSRYCSISAHRRHISSFSCRSAPKAISHSNKGASSSSKKVTKQVKETLNFVYFLFLKFMMVLYESLFYRWTLVLNRKRMRRDELNPRRSNHLEHSLRGKTRRGFHLTWKSSSRCLAIPPFEWSCCKDWVQFYVICFVQFGDNYMG